MAQLDCQHCRGCDLCERPQLDDSAGAVAGCRMSLRRKGSRLCEPRPLWEGRTDFLLRSVEATLVLPTTRSLNDDVREEDTMTENREALSDRDERPRHGDVWQRDHVGTRFSVMHVCGHHDPPHVTGYWHDKDGPNPCQHDSIPLPRFVKRFTLVEREFVAGGRG